jgi:hypothetical protein
MFQGMTTHPVILKILIKNLVTPLADYSLIKEDASILVHASDFSHLEFQLGI